MKEVGEGTKGGPEVKTETIPDSPVVEIPGHSNKPEEVDWKQSEQDLPREAPMTWETTEAPEGIHHVLENCEGAQDTRETKDSS